MAISQEFPKNTLLYSKKNPETMNNFVTIAYRFELHFTNTSLDGLKYGNIDDFNQILQELLLTLILLVVMIVLLKEVVQNAVQNLGVQNVGNQNGLIVVLGIVNQNLNRNGNLVAARAEGNANGNNGIQLQVEEFDLMAAAADLDEIEEVNANYILMANLQQASTSGTQTDKAPVYDSDGSVEVSSMEQGGGTVEQHPATHKETHAYFESLYNNLAIEVKKVNTVNRKLRETNVDLTTELARYKNQEKCFEISQEKYDELERRYQKYVYQEKCLTKKINALLLSSDPFLDLPDLVLYFKIPDSSPESFNLRDIPWVTIHLLVASVGGSTVMVEAISTSTINPFKNSREEKSMPNKPIKGSVRKNPITVSQPHALTKKGANSNSNGLSSTRVDNTAKTRRPQPRINTKNDRVPSASKNSYSKNKEVKVEEHPRNLLLSKNKKHMSSECNNVKLFIRNDKSKFVCAMDSGCLKYMTSNLELLINFVWKFLGTVHFGNDHVATILGYGDLQ
nr:integrase, catalytic region, zinc finger, CCHC-type, peptidase aspartic, catalytic [Tanacetum cinerariifolium]